MTHRVFLYGVCDYWTAEAECDDPSFRHENATTAMNILASPQCAFVRLNYCEQAIEKLAREQFDELMDGGMYDDDPDEPSLFKPTFEDIKSVLSAKRTPKGIMEEQPDHVLEYTQIDYWIDPSNEGTPDFTIVVQERSTAST